MAKIILGLGMSHGPQLSTPPEEWGQRVVADKSETAHPFKENTYSYDELVELRQTENFAAEITLDRWRQKYTACMASIEELGSIYKKAQPDVAVIIGNDQNELFQSDNNPAFCVFRGAKIAHGPHSKEQLTKMPPGIEISMRGYFPPEDMEHDGEPKLADHIIGSLMAENFDVGTSDVMPTAAARTRGAPHAFGFVYRRIMKDKVIPNVPLFQNTFFPPNQPTAQRCFDFGKAVHRAIKSWESEKTVAVFASGGLSHFVIDAELDQRILTAMQKNDFADLTAIPETMYQSGTSETKNWIATAGIMAESGLSMNIVDYIPCYRSEAGTGTAMAFASWQ